MSHDQPTFSFAVIADPHCAEPAHWRVDELGTHVDRLQRCVDVMDARRGEDRPDFAMLLGDVQWWGMPEAMRQGPIPFHMVAGNHEDMARRAELRAARPGDFQIDGEASDYYHFVHKGVRFIVVCDAGAGGDHVGHLESEAILPHGQCEWLERQFAAPEPCKVLFAHIPPAYDDTTSLFNLARNDSRFLVEQIERGRPLAAFYGHQHLATTHRTIGSTACYTLGSCAWNLDQSPLSFAIVKVTAGRVDVEQVVTG